MHTIPFSRSGHGRVRDTAVTQRCETGRHFHENGPSPKGRCVTLAVEAVEGVALALEGVHDVHGGHGLPFPMLAVGHRVTNYVFEEHFGDRAGFLVHHAGDALHATTAGEAADGRDGDALDNVKCVRENSRSV